MTDFPLSLLGVALWAYLAGAAGALVFQRFEKLANGFGFGLAAAGGLCGLVSCGAALAGKVKFCPECGAKISAAAHCTECGAKLPPGVKFCPECGTKVASAQ